MALTTASSKLRSTILFNSKDEQVLFKRSSADLAAARGLTPSALLARLPMEQLTSSDLGRWAAQLIYAEDGSCLDAFEGMFEDWSAIQPENDCRDVIKGFLTTVMKQGSASTPRASAFIISALTGTAFASLWKRLQRCPSATSTHVSRLRPAVNSKLPCKTLQRCSPLHLWSHTFSTHGSTSRAIPALTVLCSISPTSADHPARDTASPQKLESAFCTLSTNTRRKGLISR